MENWRVFFYRSNPYYISLDSVVVPKKNKVGINIGQTVSESYVGEIQKTKTPRNSAMNTDLARIALEFKRCDSG